MARGDRASLPVSERLASRTEYSASGCYLWLGYRDRDGYGHIQTGSRKDGSRRAKLCHRAIWEEAFGPIPVGMEIDHRCQQPACWNISHLRMLTEDEHHAQRSPEQRRASGINLTNFRLARVQ